MGWDDAGNFSRETNFSADASALLSISADKFDQEFDNFASAMELCWTRDGQNAPTSSLSMNTYKHLNVGPAASSDQYITVAQHRQRVGIYVLDAGAANQISANIAIPLTAYATGQQVLVRLAATNTTASVSADFGAGQKRVVLNDGTDPPSSSMIAGGIYEMLFDVSADQWRCTNITPPSTILATEDRAGTVEIATTAEVSAGLSSDKAVAPAQLAGVYNQQGSFEVKCHASTDQTGASAQATISWLKTGKVVTLSIPELVIPTNADGSACQLHTLADATVSILPNQQENVVCMVDTSVNGVTVSKAQVRAGGVIWAFYSAGAADEKTDWPGENRKGFPAQTIIYMLEGSAS